MRDGCWRRDPRKSDQNRNTSPLLIALRVIGTSSPSSIEPHHTNDRQTLIHTDLERTQKTAMELKQLPPDPIRIPTLGRRLARQPAEFTRIVCMLSNETGDNSRMVPRPTRRPPTPLITTMFRPWKSRRSLDRLFHRFRRFRRQDFSSLNES